MRMFCILIVLLLFRDAPFDTWGGGARVFVACKLFFLPPVENKFFFWRSTSDNFFLCYVEEFFCRMLSLLCTLPFGQHIFHQFRQQTFFLLTFLTNFFLWLLWRQTTFFNFNLAPPPPDIKWCVPYSVTSIYCARHLWCWIPLFNNRFVYVLRMLDRVKV